MGGRALEVFSTFGPELKPGLFQIEHPVQLRLLLFLKAFLEYAASKLTL